jgi:hypothetical protein
MCEEVKREERRGECGKGELLVPDTMNLYELLDSYSVSPWNPFDYYDITIFPHIYCYKRNSDTYVKAKLPWWRNY